MSRARAGALPARLRTTTVGSFPKPEVLQAARSKFLRGELSREQLLELERQATREVIRLQEELGLDLLVHGEMERGDMVAYFAENLDGLAVGGLVRSYGNRYYRKPVVDGELRRRGPMTVAMWEFAQSLTDRPVKGMLTGPYTICDWSFNNYYPNRREIVLRLAEIIRDEARDLQKAGAAFIQIDEPAISTRPEELELAVEAMGIITADLDAYTITHICYGHFETIYPQMLDLPVDQIDLELANNDYATLDLVKRADRPFDKDIGLGVLDVHTHRVEEKDQVVEGIRRALEVLPPERIFVDPDCGLKTRTAEEARAKLTVMVEAVKEVRRELDRQAAPS